MTYDGRMTISDPNLVAELDDMPDGYRAFIVADHDAQCPDWEGIGYVYRIDFASARGDQTMITGDATDTAPDVSVLRKAWDRYRDWETVARFARIYLDAVSVDTLDRREYTAVAVVTRTQATAWGNPPAAWPNLARQALRVYEQWADGNVYSVIVTHAETGAEESLSDVYDDSADWQYCREVAAELIAAIGARS